MKSGIHPTYNNNIQIKCACGATITAGSTRKDLSTELCSACHPFYTGKQKFVDTAGRVDKFKAKKALADKYLSTKKPKKSRSKVEKIKEDVLKNKESEE